MLAYGSLANHRRTRGALEYVREMDTLLTPLLFVSPLSLVRVSRRLAKFDASCLGHLFALSQADLRRRLTSLD